MSNTAGYGPSLIFFFTESSLIGGKLLINSGKEEVNIGFAIFGISLSIIWYIVGAHDQYLIAVFKEAVRQAADKLTKLLRPASYSGSPEEYHYVGDNNYPKIKSGIFMWGHQRKDHRGIHLSSFFPCLMILLWIIYLIILLIFF